ncbi:MAG: group II intron maturase-specific domain-containing protein [Bacteroidales bacterium]
MEQLTKRMNLWNETKSVPVSKQQVWLAYKKVRSNDGSAGVDQISISSRKRIAEKMKEMDIEHLTHKSIVGVAQHLEPYIRGWVNYYGKFRIWEMNPIFQLLRRRLVMWARKRYKRYKTSINRTYNWLKRVKEQFPGLFYHWRLGFS